MVAVRTTNETARVAIGIDVGGTKIAGGAVDGAGGVVARRQIPTEPADAGATVAGIVKVARELLAAAPAAAAVGVGAAALIDSGGVIVGAPNLAWRNLHLRSLLEDRLGVRVVVDNDVNVAVWAEHLWGAGRGAARLVMFALGTGIGGGIVIDGRLERGAHGLGAELGHMIVERGGPRCACGNDGCLEALASGTAIARMASERIAGHAESAVLAAAGGDASAITGEIVGAAAIEGDAFARDLLEEAGRALGVGLANAANIFDPDRIVVGGGVLAGTGDLILAPALEAMRSMVVEGRNRPEIPVVPAALGTDAGLIGAAALARDAASGAA